MPISVILLAAGLGSRMNSDLPKVLHPLGGVPLIAHALAAIETLAPERLVLVTGHGAAEVEAAARAYRPELTVARQAEQRGTGHAVRQAEAALAGVTGDAIVLYGDTPFIRRSTLDAMRAARTRGAAIVVLGFEARDPGDYGRLVIGPNGGLRAIVEAKDASSEQLSITLCNSGVIAADANLLFDLLAAVRNENAKGEYYLTDVVAIARGRGLTVAAITCSEDETLGINSRADLARAEAAFQTRMRVAALENGATLTDPETVWFALDTHLGRDVVIGPNVVFGPGVTLENGATIHAFCHLEGCHVSRGAVVGPFARLRPGAELGEETRVGNFVEVKNAVVGEGAKINHLSYVGDAEIGAGANIGAGTITCNYDGVSKHHTLIGSGAFIGSNSALVAPVSIGSDAIIAAGSVITSDVPDGALGFGRARQEIKPGLGRRIRERLRAQRPAGTRG